MKAETSAQDPHKVDLDLALKELPQPGDEAIDDGQATQDDIEKMLRELED